jgi:16S rRNA (uracil1498-N3)-methyltransferase
VLALIPWEDEHVGSLRPTVLAHLQTSGEVAAQAHLFIGPEGGFSREEVTLAAAHGAVPVTLGRRILRAETAALAATVLLLEALGEMG